MTELDRIPTLNNKNSQNIKSNILQIVPENSDDFSVKHIDMAKMKTGTTTIAFKIKDGVIMATDNRATMGFFVANKNSQKLHQIQENIYITIAGSVADAQYLIELLRAETEIYKLRNDKPIGVNATAKLLQNILYNKKGFYQVGHIIGGYSEKEGPKVYDLGGYGSILEEDYTSEGSGSTFAYGVLETEWKDGLDKEAGIKLAAKAVKSAIIRDIASGNGIDVVVISKGNPPEEHRFEITDESLQ